MANLVYGQSYFKARSVNQTSAAFVSKVPTGTEPTGDAGSATGASIIELGVDYFPPPKTVVNVIPFGVGADDSTMSVRIIGWAKAGTGTTALWIPVTLAELLCTLSTAVGVAAKYVVNTERFADTITLTYGNDDVSIDLGSPANNTIAIASVLIKNFQKLEISLQTGGSATSCNALISVSG